MSGSTSSSILIHHLFALFLEFPDGRVDEYAVTIIIDNLIDQIDDQRWDSGIIEEIVAFRRDPGVAIPTGEKS